MGFWDRQLGIAHPQQHLRQQILVETKKYPAWQVHHRHQPHEIQRVMRIIPRTRVPIAQPPAPRKLPRIHEGDVDGESPPHSPSLATAQVEVELLHHQAAAAVHQEGPQGRVPAQGGRWPLQGVEDGREEDLVQEAVHAEEDEAQEGGEPVGSAGAAAPLAVVQPQEAPEEHLRVVDSQPVLQPQLRRAQRPLLQAALQQLQAHEHCGVEDEVERRRRAREAPPPQVDLLQGEVSQGVQQAAGWRGEAQQVVILAAREAPHAGAQHVQGQAVHAVEIQPHPRGQGLERGGRGAGCRRVGLLQPPGAVAPAHAAGA
ncbi:hypothetical protein FKM82_018202 [Ascaphus truei]